MSRTTGIRRYDHVARSGETIYVNGKRLRWWQWRLRRKYGQFGMDWLRNGIPVEGVQGWIPRAKR